MSLNSLFEKLNRSRRKALVTYITAGDPSGGKTIAYIQALADAGADIVELGVPHSDPVADGPVNVRASERALATGGGLRAALDIVASVRKAGCHVPIVLFTYYNPVYKYGIDEFARQSQLSGVDGVLILDLPVEEAGEYAEVMSRFKIATIFLISPSTVDDRIRTIERLSTGFVYYISRAGVTGAREDLPESLPNRLKHLKTLITKPICVGFGISSAEQIEQIKACADGVIVGSALVQRIENANSHEDALHSLKTFTGKLANALN